MDKIMIYLISFSIYSLLILIAGKGGLKKTETVEDFFVGGKSMKLMPSIFTFTATWFSVASMVGFTGSVYYSGYEVLLMSVVGWFFGAGLLVLIVDPLRKYDLITIPEYFHKRYGSRKLQVFGGLTVIFCYIMYIIIQITGFGIVVSKLLDINYTMSIFMVYLFIIYTTYGGFFSVVKTDTLNIIITILGVIITAYLTISRFDSISQINIMASSMDFGDSKNILEFNASISVIVTTSIAWGLGLAVNPQYLTRISSTNSSLTAKKMISYSVFILAFMYLLLALTGMGGRVLAPELNNIVPVDEIYSHLINDTIYSKLSGMILIGIAAAAISTINSQLLILSSGFMIDIIPAIYKKPIRQDRVLNYSRLVIVVAATVSLALSFTPPSSLLTYGSIIWSIFSITFFIPIYGGSIWKKANKYGAGASIVAGLVVMFYWLQKQGFFNSSYSIHPVIPSFIAALVFFILFTFIGELYENKA
jgi:SSS family solute:Na+ symporter